MGSVTRRTLCSINALKWFSKRLYIYMRIYSGLGSHSSNMTSSRESTFCSDQWVYAVLARAVTTLWELWIIESWFMNIARVGTKSIYSYLNGIKVGPCTGVIFVLITSEFWVADGGQWSNQDRSDSLRRERKEGKRSSVLLLQAWGTICLCFGPSYTQEYPSRSLGMGWFRDIFIEHASLWT